MPDESPTPAELPFQPSLTLPGATGTPFPPADAPAPPWKMLPTSPSPAGDRWMNIFHGDETWQGRWPAENDQLLSMMDDPAELKMASANALWIADRLGESHDAVTRAYPMALGLTSLQLLGHMDGTDRDVYDAIRRSLVPDLTPEEVAQVKAAPLSLAQDYLPDLVDEENRVPELDESRAYFQLGQFPLNLPASQHEDRVPAEIELLGRARWDKNLEEKGTPAPPRNGNLASDIVMSFLGGMTESTVTMMQGPRFFGDKVAEFVPGYEGSFLDKWTNSEIAALQWLRESAQASYGVDPEFAQSYAGELTKVIGASVPQILSMGVPPLAATMIGGQSFQYAWEDAQNTARRLGQPFNRNRAFAYALTMGAVNAAMTMVKFDLVVKPWLNTGGRAVVNNAFKFLRTTLLGTTATVGQGMLNDALASGFGIEFRNPLDLERRKHDALLGTGASVVLSLSGMTLARPRQETPQPPPEKPAVTLDKSLGKQEVAVPPDESSIVKQKEGTDVEPEVHTLEGPSRLTTEEAVRLVKENPHHIVTEALTAWFGKSHIRIQSGKLTAYRHALKDFLLRLPAFEAGDRILYRGVRFETAEALAAFLRQFSEGAVWKSDRPFMSVSFEQGVAIEFAESRPFSVLMEIKKSRSARDIAPFAFLDPQYAFQKELLYTDHSLFRVLEVAKIEVGDRVMYNVILEEK